MNNSLGINKQKIAGILLMIAGFLGIVFYIDFISPTPFLIDFFEASYSKAGLEISRNLIRQYLMICGSIGITISVVPILGSLLCFKKILWKMKTRFFTWVDSFFYDSYEWDFGVKK